MTIKTVIKRDGRRRKFNPTKIVTAIKNALVETNAKFTEIELDELTDDVIEKAELSNKNTLKVEEIQDIVENVLMAKYPEAAKSFILYREERNRVRTTKSEIVKTIKEITESDLKSSNILRDNANEAGATPAGTYGKIASETNKMYNLLNDIDRKYAAEHKEGRIHIHDLNFYNLSFNCLFAPVGKLLEHGFDTGTGFLRSPTSIQTASALTAVILQLQSNQQFGGIADDNLDFDLAPYVDKSFHHNLKKELDSYIEYTGNEIPYTNDYSMNEPLCSLHAKFNHKIVDNAIMQTEKDTYQAMEALIGNLNSLQSRSGNQVPFSSLNFGLDTSNCGRMVSINLIKSQYAGLGDGLTAIFPILIFKLMRGVNKDPQDPNYDIYKGSIKVLARRFYPNFVNCDSTFNKPYIKYEEKKVKLNKKDDLYEVKYFKFGDLHFTIEYLKKPKKFEKAYYLINSTVYQLDSFDNGEILLKRLIPNTTVATMGCAIGTETVAIQDEVDRFLKRLNLINVPYLTFKLSDLWKDYSAKYNVNYEGNSEYIDLSKKLVYIKDRSNFVKCLKLIHNKNVNNFMKIEFSNEKSIMVTTDHPLYLESGRTMAESCKIGDKIDYLGEIVEITSIKYTSIVADSYDVETSSDHFELSGFNSGNCRTRVIGNINGPEQTTARGNFAFHTINLPRIAIESYLAEDDQEKRINLFFNKLDELLIDVKQSLLDRFSLISNKTYESYPFTMQQGLYLTSDDKVHNLTDKVGEVLKQSTLSIGYVGLYETILALTGKTWGKDYEIKDLGFKIIQRIFDFTKTCQKETHLNWSCFATPAEATAGRFANIDKNLFQNNKKLAKLDLFHLFGKGFYTNSHMLPYDLKTTLPNKLDWEAPFHAITNAGHIFYYKLDGDLSKNLEAVKNVIDAMYDANLGYFTVTMNSDTCINKLNNGKTCMFHGVIDNKCPKCGSQNEDDFIRVRRITGYLSGSPRKSITKSWNDGKLAELKNRVNI